MPWLARPLSSSSPFDLAHNNATIMYWRVEHGRAVAMLCTSITLELGARDTIAI